MLAEKFKDIRHGARDYRGVVQSGQYLDLALKIQRLELICQGLRTGRTNRRVGGAPCMMSKGTFLSFDSAFIPCSKQADSRTHEFESASVHLEYLAKNAKMSGMPVVITLP